jgi:hypothetical protein
MKMGDASKEFIGMGEAALAYGLDPATLRKRIEQGRLTVFFHPRDLRYRLLKVSELETLLHGPRPAGRVEIQESAAGVAF